MNASIGRGAIAVGAAAVCATAGTMLTSASTNGERAVYGTITLVSGFEVINAAVLGRWSFGGSGPPRRHARRPAVAEVPRHRPGETLPGS